MIIGAGSLWSAACNSERQPEPTDFSLEADVMALAPDLNKVTLRHDAVGGWSPASTLEYPLENPTDMERLKVGDRIRATLHADQESYRLQDVEVIMGAP